MSSVGHNLSITRLIITGMSVVLLVTAFWWAAKNRVELCYRGSYPAPGLVRLYLDTGSGFSDTPRLVAPVSEGSQSLCLIVSNINQVRAIRFLPYDSLGSIQLGNASFSRASLAPLHHFNLFDFLDIPEILSVEGHKNVNQLYHGGQPGEVISIGTDPSLTWSVDSSYRQILQNIVVESGLLLLILFVILLIQ